MATFTSPTAEQSDVNATIRTHASSGDTVIIPDVPDVDNPPVWSMGAWDAGIYGSSNSGLFLQGIILKGANGAASTKIRVALTTDSPLIQVNANSRVTGIGFVGGGPSPGRGLLYLTGPGIRVDHITIDTYNGFYFVTDNALNSVADHNTFLISSGGSSPEVFYCHNKNYPGASGITGDGSWTDDPKFGTNNFFFMEDNQFIGGSGGFHACVDGFDGARQVFRYNNVHNGFCGPHGTEGVELGNRAIEVYENNFTSDTIHEPFLGIRAGTAVVWNNRGDAGYIPWGTAAARLNTFVLMAYASPFGPHDGAGLYDVNVAGGPFASGTCTASGNTTDTFISGSFAHGSGPLTMTDSTKTWDATANNGAGEWAGHTLRNTTRGPSSFPVQGYAIILSNTATTITYEHSIGGPWGDMTFSPGNTYDIYKVDTALDQPGTGKRDLVYGVTTHAPPWPNQIVEPIYIWGNFINGVDANTVSNDHPYQTRAGEHWISGAMPGYTPYTYPHPLNDSHVPTAPTFTYAPHFTGEASIGQLLTLNQGFASGDPDPVKTQQVQRCSPDLTSIVDIAGETATTYRITPADTNKRLRWLVTATNSEGSTSTPSNVTGTVSGSSPFNLILNGGFEQNGGIAAFYQLNTGSFTAWTLTNPYGYVVATTDSNSGDAALRCTRGWGDPSNAISVSQTFGTVSGTTYPLKFYSKNDNAAPSYSVKDGHSGASIISRTPVSHATYTQTSTTFTATSDLTTFTFDFFDVFDSAYLDDVEVVPPPAPSSGGSISSTRTAKKSMPQRRK